MSVQELGEDRELARLEISWNGFMGFHMMLDSNKVDKVVLSEMEIRRLA